MFSGLPFCSCIWQFSGSMFLRIHVFQCPGFLGSRFFRVWVYVLEVAIKLIFALNFSLLHHICLQFFLFFNIRNIRTKLDRHIKVFTHVMMFVFPIANRNLIVAKLFCIQLSRKEVFRDLRFNLLCYMYIFILY